MKKASLYWIGGGVICIIALLHFYHPAGNRLSKTQIDENTSSSNLQSLCYFCREYESNHGGNAPKSLKDLVPYSDGDMDAFYLPNPKGHSDRCRNSDRLDRDSSYILVHAPHSKVIVSEKPGLFSDGTVGVVFQDGKVRRLSPKEFETLNLVP